MKPDGRDASILEFARCEAGEIPVELQVVPESFDAYEVERMPGGWRITGTNARSCLHGVYHVRDNRLPGRYRAAFSVRGLNTCESLGFHTPEQIGSLIDRMGKWRMNTLVVHVTYGWRRHRELILAECAKRGIELVFYTYTSIAFLPPDAPEAWMARDANGRPFTRRPENETRLCLAQADGLRAFEDGARRFFEEDVDGASSVLAMTGDGFGHCRCEACRDLSPAEQWQPLLERFCSAGRATAPAVNLETILYVQRYAVPHDPGAMLKLDRLFFDFHQRCRWRPLGQVHPPKTHREAEVDPRAKDVSLNIYLLDRLRDWRERFPGTLYGFENLYLHGTLSCPQPNTAVLLEDLRTLRALGVDGMVYEVLVGMESFASQLAVLADALWDPELDYRLSDVELWCAEACPPGSLFFLESAGFPWDRFKDGWDPVLRMHMENIRVFHAKPTRENLARLIEHLYAYPERFHRQFISFFLLQRLMRDSGLNGLSDRERRFLETAKLWDVMERLDDPVAETDALLQGILGKLR